MTTEDRWYVLRDLARPNAKNLAYKQLQAMPGMADCVFVPLKQHIFMEFGKRVVRFVPYMPDLVFIHKSKEELAPSSARWNCCSTAMYVAGSSLRH